MLWEKLWVGRERPKPRVDSPFLLHPYGLSDARGDDLVRVVHPREVGILHEVQEVFCMV